MPGFSNDVAIDIIVTHIRKQVRRRTYFGEVLVLRTRTARRAQHEAAQHTQQIASAISAKDAKARFETALLQRAQRRMRQRQPFGPAADERAGGVQPLAYSREKLKLTANTGAASLSTQRAHRHRPLRQIFRPAIDSSHRARPFTPVRERSETRSGVSLLLLLCNGDGDLRIVSHRPSVESPSLASALDSNEVYTPPCPKLNSVP